ncbi:peptidase MA family metallohydrolase [Chloroflexota bacterium]
MIKKVGLLALIVCLFPALLSPVPVQAADGLTILNSSVEVDFPLKLNFSLSAESDASITDIRLHYTVDQMSHARVTSEVYLEFVPATMVEVEWSWDTRKTGGLPSGSNVEYWWTVEDARGARIETRPTRVRVDDARYSWQSLTEGKVTLYWYKGDELFARELMNVAHQVLIRLAKDTGAVPEKPVKIYIYADYQDLRGAMIFPQEWTGGVAFTRHSTIAIGIAPDNLDWGTGAMAHELTHLVIHQMVFNPYNDLPTWLDEGIAMYAEGSLEPVFVTLLSKAIEEDSLISVRSLSSPFSAYAEESALAYAQSYSLVEFLITNYGQSRMLELLNTFREGSGYDDALNKVYGFDMEGLDSLWYSYLFR